MSASENGQQMVLLWIGITLLGRCYYLLGESERARAEFEKRLDHYRRTQFPMFMAANHYGLSLISLDLNDVETARIHIEESLKFAKKHSEKWQEGLSTVALGRILGKADRSQSAKAEKVMLEGINMLEELKIKPFQAEGHLYLGEFYAYIGHKEKALRALRKAKTMLQEMGMKYYLARTEKELEKLQG